MNRWSMIAVVAASTLSMMSCLAEERSTTSLECSEALYQAFEEQVPTGDGQGHGPDIGSDEWKSVIEFKLGIRGQADVPPRDSDAWCAHVDETIRRGGASPGENRDRGGSPRAADPSFSCKQVAAGSIEEMICEDGELAALDRDLSEVYVAASERATDEHPPMLEAEQRGWIKGRDDCWKSDDRHECVRNEYLRRIAELQARYRLVPSKGPVRYTCGDNAANEVVATYFATEPPTLIAERGDSVSLMFLQRSASGTRYQGPNESIWEHQGEASIVWGYGAPEMRCRKSSD